MALTRVKKVPTANLVQGSSFLTTASTLTTSNMPAGTIIQVVRNVGTTQYSNSSASTYAALTDINTTITPKAANSVLFFQMSAQTFKNGMATGQSGCEFRLRDHTNSTTIMDYRGVAFQNIASSSQSQDMQYSAFNATTSASNTDAREYRLEFRRDSTYNEQSIIYVGWNLDTNSAQSMVIYEIAQ